MHTTGLPYQAKLDNVSMYMSMNMFIYHVHTHALLKEVINEFLATTQAIMETDHAEKSLCTWNCSTFAYSTSAY